MSLLHRTFMPKLQSNLTQEDTNHDHDHDHDHDSSSSTSSTSSSSVSSTGTLRPPSSQRDGSPSSLSTSWQHYFEQELYLDGANGTKYHVYLTSPRSFDKDPIFICHHGAASSGLSFCLFAAELRKILPNAGILSVEARDHGSCVTAADGSLSNDYSLEAMSDDLLQILELTTEKLRLHPQQLQNIVMVGHSLGGAVVTHVANKGVLQARLIGYVVIDVVEGSALEALTSMRALLAKRPADFPSIDAAIQWHVRSRAIRNARSATVSVPALLRQDGPEKWVWKSDLAKTEPYWEDWFRGMSANFLTGKGAKLLLLAGTDRLDKPLMIGQMQGKFQLHVFPETGHFVHEDAPEKTADIVAEFYRRNDRSAMVLPPKVSELLKQGKKV